MERKLKERNRDDKLATFVGKQRLTFHLGPESDYRFMSVDVA